MSTGRDAITGAFGFTGRAIAWQLLGADREVVTLSRRQGTGDPLAPRIRVEPFDTDRPASLVAALAGVATLYNPYWIPLPRHGMPFDPSPQPSPPPLSPPPAP